MKIPQLTSNTLLAPAAQVKLKPSRMVRQAAVVLANSTSPFEALANDATALDDDGWALIAPFGRHPKTRQFVEDGHAKEQKFIQVLDNEAADAMVGKENSLFSKLKRALIGIPVFKGHGDLKDHDPKALANETKIKLGVVDQVRKSDRGIEAHFALDNDGACAVADGWKLPSALWLVQPFGNEADSILARPFKLLSVALTQFPNIPGVESLANAFVAVDVNPQPIPPNNQPTKNDMTLKDNLIGLLIGRGAKLPDDASDAQVLSALANDDADGDCAGDQQTLAKKAFQASAKAIDKETHIIAGVAHHTAADAYKSENEADFEKIHAAVAKFHTLQAGKL